jgi:peptidoglycan/LPS O-acetylase OafA/YrhL
LGIVLLILRRPRGWPALAVLLGAAGLVLLVHALSQDPQPEFELPLAPLFVLVALAALLGPRPGSATVPRS